MDTDKTEKQTQPTLNVVVDRNISALVHFTEERGDILLELMEDPKQSDVEIELIAQAGKLSAKMSYATDVAHALLIEAQCIELMAPYAPTATLDGEMCSLGGILKRELALLDNFHSISLGVHDKALNEGDDELAAHEAITLDAINSLMKRFQRCDDKDTAIYLTGLSLGLRGVDGDGNPNPPEPDVYSRLAFFRNEPTPEGVFSCESMVEILKTWIIGVETVLGDDHIPALEDDIKNGKQLIGWLNNCTSLDGSQGLIAYNEKAALLMGMNQPNDVSVTLSDDDKAQVLGSILSGGPYGDEVEGDDFGDSEELQDNPDDFNGGNGICDTYPMIGTKARYLTSDKGDVVPQVGIVKAIMVGPADNRLMVQLVNEAGEIHNVDGFTINYDEADYELYCDVVTKVEVISIEGNKLVQKTVEKYNEKVAKQFKRLGDIVIMDTFETKH